MLEPVVEQVADRHRHEPVELVQARARQAGAPARPRHERGEVGRVARADVRRRLEHQRPDEGRGALEQLHELRIDRGVLARDPGDRRLRGGVVAVEEDRRAVRDRRVRGVERDRLVAVLAQAQVRDDLRLEHRDDVRRARNAVAGPQLLGDARAAEHVAALEHADVEARTGEIGGRREPVVTASDDDGIDDDDFVSLPHPVVGGQVPRIAARLPRLARWSSRTR